MHVLYMYVNTVHCIGGHNVTAAVRDMFKYVCCMACHACVWHVHVR